MKKTPITRTAAREEIRRLAARRAVVALRAGTGWPEPVRQRSIARLAVLDAALRAMEGLL